jgi:hypothetical protein
MREILAVTLPGKVEDIVVSSHGPEKATIAVGDLARGLRIKNLLTTDDGKETRLNSGDDLQITISAESTATKRKI